MEAAAATAAASGGAEPSLWLCMWLRVVCRIRPLRSEEAGEEVVRVRHQQGPEAEDGRLVFGTTAFEFDRVRRPGRQEAEAGGHD